MYESSLQQTIYEQLVSTVWFVLVTEVQLPSHAMEQSPTWDTKILSATQKIACILCNLRAQSVFMTAHLLQWSTKAEILEFHPAQHIEHFKFIFNVLSTPDHLAHILVWIEPNPLTNCHIVLQKHVSLTACVPRKL